MRLIYLMLVSSLLAGSFVADNENRQVIVSPAKTLANGERVHTVTSLYQSGVTKIRVLLPDRLDEGKRYPVVYLLPVEAKDGSRYGDGLREAKKRNLANRFNVICVAPTFSRLPWYADHPTDAKLRQETHFLKVVLPAVERTYPVIAKREGRLLVGFSKSGWGAFSLLLRHPDVFHKAAAWDAPLMKAKPNQFGMGPIFGTQKNFEHYQITSLLKKQGTKLGKAPRLILAGAANFQSHHAAFRELLTDRKIPHTTIDGPKRKHTWGSGWLEDAVRGVLETPKPATSR